VTPAVERVFARFDGVCHVFPFRRTKLHDFLVPLKRQCSLADPSHHQQFEAHAELLTAAQCRSHDDAIIQLPSDGYTGTPKMISVALVESGTSTVRCAVRMCLIAGLLSQVRSGHQLESNTLKRAPHESTEDLARFGDQRVAQNIPKPCRRPFKVVQPPLTDPRFRACLESLYPFPQLPPARRFWIAPTGDVIQPNLPKSANPTIPPPVPYDHPENFPRTALRHPFARAAETFGQQMGVRNGHLHILRWVTAWAKRQPLPDAMAVREPGRCRELSAPGFLLASH
jgi:hypothetical protein